MKHTPPNNDDAKPDVVCEQKSPLLFRKAHGRDFLDNQSLKTGRGNTSPNPNERRLRTHHATEVKQCKV